MLQVGNSPTLVLRDDFVTCAVIADGVTEWQVKVQGKIPVFASRVGYRLAVVCFTEIRKLQGGGIGRVTWSRNVVFFYEIAIKNWFIHGCISAEKLVSGLYPEKCAILQGAWCPGPLIEESWRKTAIILNYSLSLAA
jgi:hypothetical protein